MEVKFYTCYSKEQHTVQEMVASGTLLDLNNSFVLSLDACVLVYGGVVGLNQTLVHNGDFVQMKSSNDGVSCYVYVMYI